MSLALSVYTEESAVESPSAASSCETEFQEALFQETLFHEALFQETLFHDAEFHETLFQDALFQEAEFQEALFQETLFHDAFPSAVLFHEAASNDWPPVVGSLATNWSRPAFGFGGLSTPAALFAVISPTPAGPPTEPLTERVVNIKAPFTWSGVKFGCRARICAATPATSGDANDVPESWM
jgi:hypothetical protein